MTPPRTVAELDAAIRLAIAALVGLGVGLEREWSGHAEGPRARFAGLRTFLILGLLGGCAGLLLAESYPSMAAVVAAGGMALCISAYLMAVRRPEIDLDGTTEAAALLVVALGTLAGSGWLALSAGTGALVVLALREKARLHWAVRRLAERELRAALQFAVLALVVLPLLPAGPVLGALAIRPRALWSFVLLFSALNFVGFLARRAAGAERGYGIMGALGGIVSSTVVTLTFSRQSAREPASSGPLATGVIGACTVLIPRILIVTAALNAPVALSLANYLIGPAVVGVAAVALAWRLQTSPSEVTSDDTENPLRIGAAIRMALAFQIAMSLIGAVRDRWGNSGVFTTASLLGLTDVDALAVSLSGLDSNIAATIAGRAIAIGVLSNTVLKLGLVLVLGSPRFRVVAGAGLVAFALATALGLWLI